MKAVELLPIHSYSVDEFSHLILCNMESVDLFHFIHIVVTFFINWSLGKIGFEKDVECHLSQC